MADNAIILLGTIILFIGLLLAIIALVVSSLQSGSGTRKSGAVLVIGPIPIIFGSDPRIARQLLILAIILFLALVIVYLLRVFEL